MTGEPSILWARTILPCRTHQSQRDMQMTDKPTYELSVQVLPVRAPIDSFHPSAHFEATLLGLATSAASFQASSRAEDSQSPCPSFVPQEIPRTISPPKVVEHQLLQHHLQLADALTPQTRCACAITARGVTSRVALGLPNRVHSHNQGPWHMLEDQKSTLGWKPIWTARAWSSSSAQVFQYPRSSL